MIWLAELFKLWKRKLICKYLLALALVSVRHYSKPEPPAYLPMNYLIDASLYQPINDKTPCTFRFLANNKTVICVKYEKGQYTVTVDDSVKIKKDKNP
jgi:hypothetical protein